FDDFACQLQQAGPSITVRLRLASRGSRRLQNAFLSAAIFFPAENFAKDARLQRLLSLITPRGGLLKTELRFASVAIPEASLKTGVIDELAISVQSLYYHSSTAIAYVRRCPEVGVGALLDQIAADLGPETLEFGPLKPPRAPSA